MRKAIGRISIAFFHIPLYCRKILIFRSSSQAKKPQSRRKPRASLRPHVSAGCVSGRGNMRGLMSWLMSWLMSRLMSWLMSWLHVLADVLADRNGKM